jgi:IPT/TIG domain-containing protein
MNPAERRVQSDGHRVASYVKTVPFTADFGWKCVQPPTVDATRRFGISDCEDAMRIWLFAGLIAMVAALGAFQALPVCTSVDPGSGKKGETIVAKGENLGKSGELYLSNGQKDTKADITSESDTEIKFKIPDIQPGRYHLLILTADKASFIEQPVVVTVQ